MAPVQAMLADPQGLAANPRTRAALAFAHERHAGQHRGADGAPFIAHPLEVAELLHAHGYPDDDAQRKAACELAPFEAERGRFERPRESLPGGASLQVSA
jgi:(p)ppGpp synthase/HD superfamily hydrolase